MKTNSFTKTKSKRDSKQSSASSAVQPGSKDPNYLGTIKTLYPQSTISGKAIASNLMEFKESLIADINTLGFPTLHYVISLGKVVKPPKKLFYVCETDANGRVTRKPYGKVSSVDDSTDDTSDDSETFYMDADEDVKGFKAEDDSTPLFSVEKVDLSEMTESMRERYVVEYYREYDKLVQEFMKHLNSIFGKIEKHLSFESQRLLEGAPGGRYRELKQKVDTLGLWKLICRTHLVDKQGCMPFKFIDSLESLLSISMGDKESVSSFEKRMIDRIDAFIAVGGKISPIHTAALFLKRLHSPRFGQFRSDINNMVIQGLRSFPADLAEASYLAQQRTEATPSGTANVGALAFISAADVTAHGDSKTGRKTKGGDHSKRKAKSDKSKESSGEAKARDSNSSESRKKKCHVCGESMSDNERHWTHECPYVTLARKGKS